MTERERRYSLNELTELSNVSVRTVRYYISEGLLPPPVTAGPRTYYTDGHLARLLLIGRYKEAYLPLREIRRRLALMSEAQIAAEAGELPEFGEELALGAMPLMLDDIPPPEWPVAGVMASMAMPPPAPTPKSGGAASYIAGLMPKALRHRVGEESEQFAAALLTPEPLTEEPGTWRRIRIGDGAELLITDDLFRRHRERIEALVAWARRILK